MTRFVHAGDIHLGFEQYGLPEREDDFYRAFLRVVDYACENTVDFVLITGDLLHKASQTDALALLQATSGLERLRRAGIPVLAIEGNHELQHQADTISFPQYLNSLQLITLLDLQIDHLGRKTLPAWDPEQRRGGYIDLGDIRVYGVRYMGAQTAKILEDVAEEIDRGDASFVILMLHVGLEGEIPHMHGGLSMAQLAPIRKRVDYLALGHVHKMLERDGWIFNPGSTETCGMDETGAGWPHGFFAVEIENGRATVSHHSTEVRPFCRLRIDVEGAETPAALVERVRAGVDATGELEDGAVVEVTLAGMTTFNRHELPEDRVRAAVESRCNPLAVRIRYSISSVGVGVDRTEQGRRADLERAVVEQLIRQHPQYSGRAREWTDIALNVKRDIADGRAPGAIAEYIRDSRARLEANQALPAQESDQPPEPTEDVQEEPDPKAEVKQLGLPV